MRIFKAIGIYLLEWVKKAILFGYQRKNWETIVKCVEVAYQVTRMINFRKNVLNDHSQLDFVVKQFAQKTNILTTPEIEAITKKVNDDPKNRIKFDFDTSNGSVSASINDLRATWSPKNGAVQFGLSKQI